MPWKLNLVYESWKNVGGNYNKVGKVLLCLKMINDPIILVQEK